MSFLGTEIKLVEKKFDSYFYFLKILNAHAQKTVHFQTFWESKNNSYQSQFRKFQNSIKLKPPTSHPLFRIEYPGLPRLMASVCERFINSGNSGLKGKLFRVVYSSCGGGCAEAGHGISLWVVGLRHWPRGGGGTGARAGRALDSGVGGHQATGLIYNFITRG
jgi:hypothetical protein